MGQDGNGLRNPSASATQKPPILNQQPLRPAALSTRPVLSCLNHLERTKRLLGRGSSVLLIAMLDGQRVDATMYSPDAWAEL